MSLVNTSYAAYASGSGTRTLRFLYIVRIGDEIDRINIATSSSLVLNGTLQNNDDLDADIYTYINTHDPRSLNYSSAVSLSSEKPIAETVWTKMEDGVYTVGHDIATTPYHPPPPPLPPHMSMCTSDF